MTFREALERKVLVFDGAMGTQIQRHQLAASEFGGEEGANDLLVVTRPDLVLDIHAAYLEAGADVLETNTFGSNRLKLDEYGAGRRTYEINFKAATLAKQAAERFSSPGKPRFVAGSMGPTGFLPAASDPVLSKISVDHLERLFHEQAKALVEGGCDALIVETTQDMLELRAALFGIHRFLRESSRRVVVIAQVTLDPNGRMLLGTDIGAALATLEGLPCDVIGMNCSTGPLEMRDSVRTLAEHCSKPVSIIPNAGMPENVDGLAAYRLDPETFSRELRSFVVDFGVDIVGGCCGTTPEHIRQLAAAVEGIPGGRRSGKRPIPAVSSMLKMVPLGLEPKPLLVGERVNSQGSRKMKELLLADDLDTVLQIARDQVEGGAHVLDVCVALTERADEREQMRKLCKLLSLAVEAPLMVDSTEADVIEAALQVIPGRAIVNSVNLEKSGERVAKVLPLVRKFGAAVVAMTIDERGMAQTAERKLEVAERIFQLATEEYGLAPEQLIYDPLTFTLATGSEEYLNSAVDTIEGIRRIKARLPGVSTTLGVSNVSFGLSKQARPVLNSVFLFHAVKAGLDLAIINPKEILPYPSIPEAERKLAEDLVLNRAPDALPKLIAHFEGKSGGPQQSDAATRARAQAEQLASMPAEERIHFQIVNRIPDEIEKLLDDAMTRAPAVGVLNDVLLPAMKEVGDRFGAGELILPFVLQSAEVMKKAVAHVEKFLDKDDATTKGRVVLATVYGDVHDIGKNLVKTILSNNGFEVHDLGKQVPVNTILEKAQEVNADVIGLSALLVSTSKQMPYCVQELSRRQLSIPVMIGGAAINRKFGFRSLYTEDGAAYPGGVFYCKDAFEGLDAARALVVPASRKELFEETVRRAERAAQFAETDPAEEARAAKERAKGKRSKVVPAAAPPTPPFWGTKVLRDINLREVFPCMDHTSLFKLSWGVRAKNKEDYEKLLEEFRPKLEALQDEAIEKSWLRGAAVYGYFPVHAEGVELVVHDPNAHDRELTRLEFPRMPDSPWLCLPDYFRGKEGPLDVAVFQVVTVGDTATRLCEELQAAGDYTKSYFLHGLSVEAAEGMAEWLHQNVRRELGLEVGQGKRYSPGYPSWPELSDQPKLWQLLRPDEVLGVTLTEAHQMVPEQSTSAIVLHHPEATYFTIRSRPGLSKVGGEGTC